MCFCSRYILFLPVMLFPTTTYAQDWQPLFDGMSLKGWVTESGHQADETNGWEVVDGTLHLDQAESSGGNLLTDRDFGDFELVFEWKVAAQGNNGIKYRVQQYDQRTLGIEYQVIDDLGRPNLEADQKTASIYDIVAAKHHNYLRPAGQFNRGRILVHNNHLQHWLNGHLICEIQVGSDEWNLQIAQSKFADVPGFGMNRFGRIMLTDHNDEVWYRNIFVRELSPLGQATAHLVSRTFQPQFVSSFEQQCCSKSFCKPRFQRCDKLRGLRGHFRERRTR